MLVRHFCEAELDDLLDADGYAELIGE